MLLEIDNFEQFKTYFDAVYEITDLIELQFFEDHMFCSILDKARTRFMSATYQKEFFAGYDVDGAESVTIDADDMYKIIKSSNKKDKVILKTNDNYLICTIESDNGNSRTFEFVLPAEYIESPQSPEISLPVSLVVGLDDIKQGVKDLKIIGSGEVMFTINDDVLSISSGNEVTTNYVLNIPIDPTGETLSARYSLEYIEQLLDFDKINKEVNLSIGDNFPLLYAIEDDIMCISINGMIAPRIEVDD